MYPSESVSDFCKVATLSDVSGCGVLFVFEQAVANKRSTKHVAMRYFMSHILLVCCQRAALNRINISGHSKRHRYCIISSVTFQVCYYVGMKTSTSAMPKTTIQVSKSKNKKKIVIGVVAVLAFVVAGLVAWLFWQTNQPHPLGDKLDYIGKDSYGYGISDGPPTTDYYYATDMTVDEVVAYFKGATNTKKGELETNFGKDITSMWLIYFQSKSSSENFTISYYSDGNLVAKNNDFKVSKKHILNINSREYDIAHKNL